jgi:hypothetical protein
MLTIGIDPDLHDLAVGYWDNGPRTAYVTHVAHRKGRIGQTAVMDMILAMRLEVPFIDRDHDVDAVAVEAQTLMRSGSKQHKRPQDIVILGNVAGAVLGMLAGAGYPSILFPTPEQWKGQLPKHVMQARLYDELGWGYEMCASDSYAVPLRIPNTFEHITKGQWKHVGDALLLARWAYEKRTK